jgi:hypothetical protein
MVSRSASQTPTHFAGHSSGSLGQSRAAMLALLNRMQRQSWQSKQQFDAD